jgi:F-type H+-transporting ATPase subunit delta
VMHAASRDALTALRPRIDAVIARFSSVDGLTTLAAELYAVADLLTRQPRLRRLLADPATPAAGRADLAATLFGGKVSASALQLVQAAAEQRWSSPWDLLDSFETAGNEVLVAAAENEGAMDRVEDELFRFERILEAESDLSVLLDEAAATPDRRRELLARVIEGKVHPLTLALLDHAVASQRKRSVLLAIDDLIQAAATRRERSIARVTSATALSDKQQRDLAHALTDLYGREIEVRTSIDPAVRGGLVVRVGDELIDGSVASRLNQARAAFAG